MSRWIGRDAVPALLADVFGVEDRTQLKQGKASLPVLDNEYSERVRAGKSGLWEGDWGWNVLTWSSGGEVERSQVQGRRVYYAAYALHCQGGRRAEPEAVGANIACGRPSRPGRESCSMDKQAPRKGRTVIVCMCVCLCARTVLTYFCAQVVQ